MASEETKVTYIKLDDLLNLYEELPSGHDEGYKDTELRIPGIEYYEQNKKT